MPITDHTSLDQSSEACAEEWSQMSRVELVENAPHLTVAGDRAPASIDAAQITALGFGLLFEIERSPVFPVVEHSLSPCRQFMINGFGCILVFGNICG
jgi:hypothetical protein